MLISNSFKKNDVTLTRHGVMTRSHRKSKLASFCAENIFRKSHRRNFGCWSRCLSKLQKCALGLILPPLGRGRVNILQTDHEYLEFQSQSLKSRHLFYNIFDILDLENVEVNTKIKFLSYLHPEISKNHATVVGG